MTSPMKTPRTHVSCINFCLLFPLTTKRSEATHSISAARVGDMWNIPLGVRSARNTPSGAAPMEYITCPLTPGHPHLYWTKIHEAIWEKQEKWAGSSAFSLSLLNVTEGKWIRNHMTSGLDPREEKNLKYQNCFQRINDCALYQHTIQTI